MDGRHKDARQGTRWTRLLTVFLSTLVCAVFLSCGRAADTGAIGQGKEVTQTTTEMAKPVEKAKDNILVLSADALCPAMGPPGVVIMNEGQVQPPDPFVIIKYEKDIWRKWKIGKEVALYKDKDVNSQVVGRLAPGSIIWVTQAELWTHPAKLLVTQEKSLNYGPLTGRKFAKGDLIYVLYLFEEDMYRVWHKGVVIYLGLGQVKGTEYYNPGYAEKAWGELQENTRKNEELWMMITGPDSVTGWVKYDRENMVTAR